DSLNLALHGLLRQGDHVVTTVVEHNSILRPLRALEQQGIVTVDRVACDARGIVDPQRIREAAKPGTRLIAMLHASNVTGAVQPVAEAAAIARETGALFLLDAAQTAGHMPLNVAELPVDLLAASGHKGLLGPLGVGILYVRPGVEESLASVRQGGTGSESENDSQPDALPDKYESGNLNVPGILGLGAGVEWLLQQGVETIHARGQQLIDRLITDLRGISGATLYGPQDAAAQIGVVSLNITNYDPREAATLLDAACRIQARAGLHCAPLMHQALGTLDQGGTIRFSVGAMNTESDVVAAANAVREIARSAAMT
ncbi:MAG: aminotransferase class V-fold PLP-dependent enzyme, partial [Planctomycetales bacterium]